MPEDLQTSEPKSGGVVQRRLPSQPHPPGDGLDQASAFGGCLHPPRHLAPDGGSQGRGGKVGGQDEAAERGRGEAGRKSRGKVVGGGL